MTAESWLPGLLRKADYRNEDDFISAAYAIYARDFIESSPMLLSKKVKSKRWEPKEGMDHSFWHCVEEKIKGVPVCEENRIPKQALVERIRWPRPVIEHVAKSPDVIAWKEIYRGHGTVERVHLLLDSQQYVVVLDPRGKDESGNPKYYFLWTTYLVEGKRMRQEIRRRCENGRPL